MVCYLLNHIFSLVSTRYLQLKGGDANEVLSNVTFPASCYSVAKICVSKQSLLTLRQRWMYEKSGFLWLTDEDYIFDHCFVSIKCLFYHIGDKRLHCTVGYTFQEVLKC